MTSALVKDDSVFFCNSAYFACNFLYLRSAKEGKPGWFRRSEQIIESNKIRGFPLAALMLSSFLDHSLDKKPTKLEIYNLSSERCLRENGEWAVPGHCVVRSFPAFYVLVYRVETRFFTT